MRIRATLLSTGKTTTGFALTPEQVDALGGGKRPPVTVTINGFTYRNTIAAMGGVSMLGVSAENRAGAGIAAGDEVDIDLELDTAPRVVEVPDDLAAALTTAPAASAFWDTLSYSNQRWHAEQITGAKTPETRAKRVAKSIELLSAGKAR